MLIFLTVVHVVASLFLIIVVLLQSGKAADLAGAFGGMGSQTAFGPRGAATVLSKATTTAAVIFMVTSIWLGIETGRDQGTGQSVIERTGAAATPAGTPTATVETEVEPVLPGTPLVEQPEVTVVPSVEAGAEETPAPPAGGEQPQP